MNEPEEVEHEPGRTPGGSGGGGAVVSGGGRPRWPDIARAPEGTTAGLTLPVYRSTEPIRATKFAQLGYEGGVPRLMATRFGLTYGVDDVARCARNRNRNHASPGTWCTCGFYAYRPGWTFRSWWGGMALLDVEFLGRVVVHEKGYRAGRQRVLAVQLSRQCHGGGEYGDPRCSAPAATVVLSSGANVSRLIMGQPVEPAQAGDRLRIDGVCDRHDPAGWATTYASPFPPLTPAELAGMLGTEVAWS